MGRLRLGGVRVVVQGNSAKLGSPLGCQVPKIVLSSSRTSVRDIEISEKGGREEPGGGRALRGEKEGERKIDPGPAGQLPPLPSPLLHPTPVLCSEGLVVPTCLPR